MTKEQERGDILIAEFMEVKYVVIGDAVCFNVADSEKYPLRCEVRYRTSWDWLMPVIEKIEKIHDDFHGYFGVHIYSNSCTIQGTNLRTDPENFHPAYLSDPNAIFETKLESTWYNVVQFIKWYNEFKKIKS